MTPLTQSYVRGDTTKPLLEATLGRFFDSIVDRYPDCDAVVSRHQNIHWTYRQFQEQVDALAAEHRPQHERGIVLQRLPQPGVGVNLSRLAGQRLTHPP